MTPVGVASLVASEAEGFQKYTKPEAEHISD